MPWVRNVAALKRPTAENSRRGYRLCCILPSPARWLDRRRLAPSVHQPLPVPGPNSGRRRNSFLLNSSILVFDPLQFSARSTYRPVGWQIGPPQRPPNETKVTNETNGIENFK